MHGYCVLGPANRYECTVCHSQDVHSCPSYLDKFSCAPDAAALVWLHYHDYLVSSVRKQSCRSSAKRTQCQYLPLFHLKPFLLVLLLSFWGHFSLQIRNNAAFLWVTLYVTCQWHANFVQSWLANKSVLVDIQYIGFQCQTTNHLFS